jgi:hypothetical protein
VLLQGVREPGNPGFGERIDDAAIRRALGRNVCGLLTQDDGTVGEEVSQHQIVEYARVSGGHVGQYQMRLLEPEAALVERQTSPQHLITTENVHGDANSPQGWQEYMRIDGEEGWPFFA